MFRANLGAPEYPKYPQVAGKSDTGAVRDLLPGWNSLGYLSLALNTWANELNLEYLTWAQALLDLQLTEELNLGTLFWQVRAVVENLNWGSRPYKVKGALPEKLCKGKVLHTNMHAHSHQVLPAHYVIQQGIIFLKQCKSRSTDKKAFCCESLLSLGNCFQCYWQTLYSVNRAYIRQINKCRCAFL